jgi:hypothetical protein
LLNLSSQNKNLKEFTGAGKVDLTAVSPKNHQKLNTFASAARSIK